jgi:hypothetical protein
MVNKGGDGNDLPLDQLESGLTPEQYKKIPDYTAARSACPTCGRKLNGEMPTLEELEALPVPQGT